MVFNLIHYSQFVTHVTHVQSHRHTCRYTHNKLLNMWADVLFIHLHVNKYISISIKYIHIHSNMHIYL